jgi:hypothetical protein
MVYDFLIGTVKSENNTKYETKTEQVFEMLYYGNPKRCAPDTIHNSCKILWSDFNIDFYIRGLGDARSFRTLIS